MSPEEEAYLGIFYQVAIDNARDIGHDDTSVLTDYIAEYFRKAYPADDFAIKRIVCDCKTRVSIAWLKKSKGIRFAEIHADPSHESWIHPETTDLSAFLTSIPRAKDLRQWEENDDRRFKQSLKNYITYWVMRRCSPLFDNTRYEKWMTDIKE